MADVDDSSDTSDYMLLHLARKLLVYTVFFF